MPQRYNPPPGWPVPSGGWRPSFDWKPDPSWPPAPSGWVFWVKEEPVPEHVAAWKLSRKYVGAVVAVGLVGVGALAIGLGADELRGGHPAATASPDWWGSGPVLGPLPAPKRKDTVEIKASLVGMPIESSRSGRGVGSTAGPGTSAGSRSSTAAGGSIAASTGSRSSRREASRGTAAHRSRVDQFGWNRSGHEPAFGHTAVQENSSKQRSRHRAASSESFAWFGTSGYQTAGHQAGSHQSGPRHRAEGHASSHAHHHASHHGKRH